MKKLVLTLLLATGYFAIGGPKAKPTPTPSPTPPPVVAGETYYKWLNDFAHWVETHPATPDQ
jgi:hypothetical protein